MGTWYSFLSLTKVDQDGCFACFYCEERVDPRQRFDNLDIVDSICPACFV